LQFLDTKPILCVGGKDKVIKRGFNLEEEVTKMGKTKETRSQTVNNRESSDYTDRWEKDYMGCTIVEGHCIHYHESGDVIDSHGDMMGISKTSKT
jgi:hypothetical protein